MSERADPLISPSPHQLVSWFDLNNMHRQIFFCKKTAFITIDFRRSSSLFLGDKTCHVTHNIVKIDIQRSLRLWGKRTVGHYSCRYLAKSYQKVLR